MSMEAIAAVEKAEADAARLKADTEQEVRRGSAAAEAEGKQAIEAARKRAAEVLKGVNAKADEKAAADAKELWSGTENRKAALRARAEGRLDKAAARIAERIVNG